MRNKIAIGVVFLFGCATGGVASQLVVPPAKAGAAVTTWDYYCIDFDSGEENQIETGLKEAGGQGWELATVNSNNGIHCLKRAL